MKILCITMVFFFALSCKSKEKLEIYKKHYNIKIAVDLSNRITKPEYKCIISDGEIIASVLDLIYPTITNHKRKINQMDKYELDFINKKHIIDYKVNTKSCVIDLSVFKNEQLSRNDYLGVFKNKSQFKEDKKNFLSEFVKLEENINIQNHYGSDIYSYFENLTPDEIDINSQIIDDEDEIVVNETENIIILLTDGYLETSSINDNSKVSKDLSSQKISSFRQDYSSLGGGQKIEDFFSANGYGILPVTNPVLSKTKILVLQLFDRNATSGKNAHDLSDMKIIELFWSDWFVKSGVKPNNFKLVSHTETSSVKKINSIILSFLGIN